MVLEKTRGRVKELTKVSDDRNNEEKQFLAVRQFFSTTDNMEVLKYDDHKLC